MKIPPSDASVCVGTGIIEAPILVLAGDDIAQVLKGPRDVTVPIGRVDGNVFSALAGRQGAHTVTATLRRGPLATRCPAGMVGHSVEVSVTAMTEPSAGHRQDVVCADGQIYVVEATVFLDGMRHAAAVRVAPMKEDLFSRARGLIETSVLAGKKVLIKGLGSVGAPTSKLLAQSGVSRFLLMDPQRIEVGNVERHEAGIADIGRLKTNVVKELILEKNPYAQVHTCPEGLDESNTDRFREACRWADVIIDTGDERPGKLLANRIVYDEGKTLIVSGCYRRAHGGAVVRIRPGTSGCYHCYIDGLPQNKSVFSAPVDSEGVAYADRPVPVEPGLAIDINPICHMTAKLALQELLWDVPTTLRSLDDDLSQDVYMWLNRREAGTGYEKLDPLGNGVDGLRILRWYGMQLEPLPGCPVCGSVKQPFVEREGITISDQERSTFQALFEQEDHHNG